MHKRMQTCTRTHLRIQERAGTYSHTQPLTYARTQTNTHHAYYCEVQLNTLTLKRSDNKASTHHLFRTAMANVSAVIVLPLEGTRLRTWIRFSEDRVLETRCRIECTRLSGSRSCRALLRTSSTLLGRERGVMAGRSDDEWQDVAFLGGVMSTCREPPWKRH